MDDLISRAALKDELEHIWLGIKYSCSTGYEIGMERAMRVVADAPAVAAEPVRHGRWMIHHYDMEKYEYTEIPHNSKAFNSWDGNMYCSICKGDALCNGREEQVPSSRCPACGARMDGRGEGDAK